MLRLIIKRANGLVSLITGLALLLAGSYAGYCLWDNQHIYSSAENVQSELLRLKPKNPDSGDTGPTFDELLVVNSDVRAWVSLENTKIDHPVLQGTSNMDYLNMDIYGNFALAGSIFLDSRNKGDFSDKYSVLYGHHMDKSAMFGDLDKYLEEKFFNANDTGELMIPGKVYTLKVIACMQTGASEDRIFDPTTWSYNVQGLLSFAKKQSLHCRDDAINALNEDIKNGKAVQLLALTTCSSDFTDARTIVLTSMSEVTSVANGGNKQ